MRVAVTGSRGFIGQGVGKAASAAGHEVLGFSRSSQPAPGWTGAHRQADVAQTDLVEPLLGFHPDVVVHAAGPASVGASFGDPLGDLKASLLTWANLLDSLRRAKLEPVILFVSSASVYGQPRSLPVREDAEARPLSPYGWHKLACEELARGYAACFGLPIILCRLFSVLGPGQKRLLIWDIFKQLEDPAAETVLLRGTGEETRDFLHISDVARALVSLAGSEGARAETPLVVNVASGRGSSVREVAELLSGLHGSGKPIRYEGRENPGEPDRWIADIGLLQSHLGHWEPLDLDDALKACIDEWRA
jgi:UDP-glucose 4-epimerase